jgi:CRISPR-associated endonuclease/helicase Cas3
MRLADLPARHGVDPEAQRVAAIVAETEVVIAALNAGGTPHPAVGVILNRVSRARLAFEKLKQEQADAEVVLLIGPARAVDREKRTREELSPLKTSGSERRTLDRTRIIVATQTIEAGVDIDFDGLVTEAAALDALRQRVGRLNRAGRDINARGAVLAHRDDVAAKAQDPIYGDRIAKTWAALTELATERVVDFGIKALSSRLAPQKAETLASPRIDAPILLPAYADLWSHTSPIPHADPGIGLFLHGLERAPASVTVAWRADIAETELVEKNRERLIELLKLASPRAAETIELPLWAVRRWLRRPDEPMTFLSDVAESPPEDEGRERGRPAFRWAGPDSGRTGPAWASDLRPGDLILVPASYGGCDEWGWNPQSVAPVVDVAEAAVRPYRTRRFLVRVTADLIRQAPIAEGSSPLPELDDIRFRLSSLLAEHREVSATDLLEAVLGLEFLAERLRQDLALLRNRKRRLERVFSVYGDDDGAPRGVVFVAPFGINDAVEDFGDESAPPATESDDFGSAAGYAQSLDEHSAEVESKVKEFAKRLGLPTAMAADLALAAYLHDAVKADRRIQAYLAGGDPFEADATNVLAKSGRASLPPNAAQRAGLPNHWRHEALSARMAPLHRRFADARDPMLALFLIGAHHGYGRSLFPHADPWDERPQALPRVLDQEWPLGPGHGPQSLAFEFAGCDWAQMFERLRQRYGVWGLARLEALIRLADHRASEAAQQRYIGERASR